MLKKFIKSFVVYKRERETNREGKKRERKKEKKGGRMDSGSVTSGTQTISGSERRKIYRLVIPSRFLS